MKKIIVNMFFLLAILNFGLSFTVGKTQVKSFGLITNERGEREISGEHIIIESSVMTLGNKEILKKGFIIEVKKGQVLTIKNSNEKIIAELKEGRYKLSIDINNKTTKNVQKSFLLIK